MQECAGTAEGRDMLHEHVGRNFPTFSFVPTKEIKQQLVEVQLARVEVQQERVEVQQEQVEDTTTETLLAQSAVDEVMSELDASVYQQMRLVVQRDGGSQLDINSAMNKLMQPLMATDMN